MPSKAEKRGWLAGDRVSKSRDSLCWPIKPHLFTGLGLLLVLMYRKKLQ